MNSVRSWEFELGVENRDQHYQLIPDFTPNSEL